jgi:hypothetical protein
VKDFIFALLCAFISLFVFITSKAFNVEENAFSLAFNPAFYPRILGTVLFVLSCVFMVQAIRKGALKNIKIAVDSRKLFKVCRLFVVVVLYVVLLNFFGYIPSSLLCIFLFIRLYGGTFRQAILYTVIVTFLLYLIFQIGFKIPLPAGEIFG